MQSLNRKSGIIAITEGKPKYLKNKLFSSEFYLDAYNLLVNNNFDDNSCRGTLLYVIKWLNASLLPLPCDFQEHVFVEIQRKCSDQNMIAGNVYCSPNSSCDNDLKLRDIISYIYNKFRGHKQIDGDFNYGNIDWKSWAGGNDETKFLSCLRNNFLLQHVTETTWFRASDEPHILDLILTDENFISDLEYLRPVGKSDHVVLSFDCELGITSCNNSFKFNFIKGDYDQLRLFMDRNWKKEFEPLGDNVNDVWNYCLF